MVVPYHQQDDENKCGPAVLMMHMELARPTVALLKQDDIASHIAPHNVAPFRTSPEAMLFGLKDLVGPDAHGNQFVCNPDPSFDAAMARIVSAFAQPDPTPPVAAYAGGAHWVVITDVVTAGTAVKTVYINSPAEVIDDRKPPPEHQLRDTCGRTCQRGIANVVFGLNCWSKYFHKVGATVDVNGTPTLKDFGFLTMTRGVPEPVGAALAVQAELGTPSQRQNADNLNDLDNLDSLRGLMDEYELRTRGPLADAMQRVDGVGPTLAVRNLSVPDASYQLTTLLSGGAPVGSIARDNGDFCSAHAVFEPCPTVSAADVPKLLADFAPADEISVDEALVWMPCRESVVPLLPFYRATYRSQERFVRIDGVTFPRLTPLDDLRFMPRQET